MRQARIDAARRWQPQLPQPPRKQNRILKRTRKLSPLRKKPNRRSQTELTKRQQAFDTATSAQQRAQEAIPAHQSIIAEEAIRQQSLPATSCRRPVATIRARNTRFLISRSAATTNDRFRPRGWNDSKLPRQRRTTGAERVIDDRRSTDASCFGRWFGVGLCENLEPRSDQHANSLGTRTHDRLGGWAIRSLAIV